MRQRRSPSLSAQLGSMLGEPWDFPGRPLRHDYDQWTVDDDWSRPFPISDAEVDLYEAYFGDLFDEMFGPSR